MISQPCVTNNRIEHRASSIEYSAPLALRSPHCGTKEISGLLSVGSWSARSARYFSHFFKLLTDYRSLEAIDGNACLAVARRKRACLAVTQ